METRGQIQPEEQLANNLNLLFNRNFCPQPQPQPLDQPQTQSQPIGQPQPQNYVQPQPRFPPKVTFELDGNELEDGNEPHRSLDAVWDEKSCMRAELCEWQRAAGRIQAYPTVKLPL